MRQLGKYWAHVLVRGILSIIFGLVAIFDPALALEILVLIFAVYSIIDGVVAFAIGIDVKEGLFILEGIIGVLVGLYIFFNTSQSITIFILVVGIWALITGVLEILAGLSLRKHLANEIFLLAVGVISVAFGVFVLTKPALIGLTIAYLIGLYALVFGFFLVLLALTLKSFAPRKLATRTPKRKRRR